MTENNSKKRLPLFRDDFGKIAIWQTPNVPLSLWFGLKALSYLISDERIRISLDHLSMAFLFTWAYLELTQGVNYFRRALGLIVILACILRMILLT